jgi:hypothetical protein
MSRPFAFGFGFWDLGFASDFGLRISGLSRVLDDPDCLPRRREGHEENHANVSFEFLRVLRAFAVTHPICASATGGCS